MAVVDFRFISVCILVCVMSREFTRDLVTKFLPAQFPWLIHSKIFNLTKCREVLLKYSLLITHRGMPIQIWHQLRERLTDSFFEIISSLIEYFWGKLDLPVNVGFCMPSLLFTISTGTDRRARNRYSKHQWSSHFSCFFERAEIQMPVKAELFPEESILRFIHQLQHRKLFAQRLCPTFRGNGNTIIVGDSQTSPLPIFFLREWGGGGRGRLYTS